MIAVGPNTRGLRQQEIYGAERHGEPGIRVGVTKPTLGRRKRSRRR